ncbi:CotD family spore coat protein [Halobacillus naozhouensis]|uniref:CotD family spore coat protein n=1 Tax=Halobacillus naozhouensis TaxID=554880 RepID=A0ABY8ISY1_9BACI|nr:CotD family spore coat protein [Halobacillus naozhouensis]WFT73064.1 CotD family spore coat protein [Halobacillus naozhouensis]
MNYRHCPHVRQCRPVVYPVHHCVQDNYFVENIDHIHPTHLTIQNHHLLNNYHYFPQTVSQTNGYNEENYYMPQGMEPQGYNWMDAQMQQEQGFMEMPQGQMGSAPSFPMPLQPFNMPEE